MPTVASLPRYRNDSSPGSKVDYVGVSRYLREIGRYRLLSAEETERLTRLVREENSQWAGRELVAGNLRLVVRVVMDFQKYWMDNFLDLIQEGNLGLARAVRKFDPSRGVKFSSYAGYWIRAYVLKFIMDNCRLVKIGTTQAQRKLFYRLNRERKLLSVQGIEAQVPVLSARLKVKEREVEAMGQRLDNSELSLESSFRGEGHGEPGLTLAAEGPGVEDYVADQEIICRCRERLEAGIGNLSDRERAILGQRLLAEEPCTLAVIAAQFGVSRERIRQIEAELMVKLRVILQQMAA